MGSKFSQTNKEEKSPEKNYNDYKKYNLEPYDTSISQKTNEYTGKSPITTTTEFIDNENGSLPFKFEWKGEGKEVLLTGDFNDWKGKIIMKKNDITGFYETVLPLERKKYNFKFVIDGNWVCSSQYPTNYDEHQNLNNFITLYNYSPPKELYIETENDSKNYRSINSNENKNNIDNYNNHVNKKNQVIFKKEDSKKKPYNCKFPLINELNTIAPTIMSHYKPIFNLNYPSKQVALNKYIELMTNNKGKIDNNEKKEKNLVYKEKNFNNENNTYKKIMTCPHEKLMHFCTNLEDLKNINNNFLKVCTTIRTKHKFLTMIYYKPK
jgi:hypothetical protein